MDKTPQKKSPFVRFGDRVGLLSEMKGSDIASALSSEQRTLIAASLRGESKKASPAGSRVQIVARAVAGEDACKGKADLALAMLADDELRGVPASGLVKLLRASGAGVSKADAARAEMRQAIKASGGRVH